MREGQLVARALEELFADDLADPLGLRASPSGSPPGRPRSPSGRFVARTSRSRSTLSPVFAEMGTMSRNAWSAASSASSGSRRSFLSRSILFSARIAGVPARATSSRMNSSPGPRLVGGVDDEEDQRRPSRGRRSPRAPWPRSSGTAGGGSRACPRARSRSPGAGPRRGCACAWSAACRRRSRPSRPTSALTSVDLPALGRPTTATSPTFTRSAFGRDRGPREPAHRAPSARSARGGRGAGPPPRP